MSATSRWFIDRRVKLTYLGDGEIEVSTIFDPMCYQWETVVFGGVFDMCQVKYSSRESAITGHDKVVKMIRESGR